MALKYIVILSPPIFRRVHETHLFPRKIIISVRLATGLSFINFRIFHSDIYSDNLLYSHIILNYAKKLRTVIWFLSSNMYAFISVSISLTYLSILKVISLDFFCNLPSILWVL